MMNKRPHEYVVQTRLSITHFTTLCEIVKRKKPHESFSAAHVARVMLERFAELLIEAGEGREFKSYQEANEYMISIGMKRQGRNVQTAIKVLDSINPGTMDYMNSSTEGASEPGVLDPQEVLRRMEQLEKGNSDE